MLTKDLTGRAGRVWMHGEAECMQEGVGGAVLGRFAGIFVVFCLDLGGSKRIKKNKKKTD